VEQWRYCTVLFEKRSLGERIFHKFGGIFRGFQGDSFNKRKDGEKCAKNLVFSKIRDIMGLSRKEER
jgi:hypothetical protein